ncbi:MAG: phosphatidate cytidylyltransferase [Pseudomonadota bacterium]|nr:phosphatidate cytidylyltransferase [Pseudomonadota bacterium]
MLKQRIITAAILGPLMVAGLFGLDGGGFAIFTGGVVALAAWEWANLAGIVRLAPRLAYVAALVALMIVGWFSGAVHATWPLWLALGGWLLSFLWVARYPDGGHQWRSTPRRALIGMWVLLPCWVGFVQLRADGLEWLLYVLLLVWLADIGAYFAGRRFGRRKLAPRVSPGKSWEGVYGGMMITALLAMGYATGLSLNIADTLWLVVATLLVTLVSVLGDLLESMFKRWRGIKDSGRVLPGHGGILDRIDSLTAAVPLFALLRLWL